MVAPWTMWLWPLVAHWSHLENESPASVFSSLGLRSQWGVGKDSVFGVAGCGGRGAAQEGPL